MSSMVCVLLSADIGCFSSVNGGVWVRILLNCDVVCIHDIGSGI